LYSKARQGLKKFVFETRKWIYLDVLIFMQCETIHKLAVRLSKNVPGSVEYLSQYHKAHVQVKAMLTNNQHQKYKAMAKEWSEKKLPPRMQQQYAHGNDSSRLEFTDFSTLV